VGATGAVDDVDTEDGRPRMVGQDERPAPFQAVVGEELRPALGEVALPSSSWRTSMWYRGWPPLPSSTMKLVGGFVPIVPMKLAGSGRRSLHPASRGTMEVANPCFGM
jgi:hypothetical protein